MLASITKRTQSKAFTLIELLVVISIIALLLSILLPSLQKAKEQAKKVVCLSNIRQLSIGYEMYLQDSNNKYPTAYYIRASAADTEVANCWYSAVKPYLGDGKKVYLCPSATKPESPSNSGLPNVAFNPSMYGYSKELDLPLFSYGHNDWVLSGKFNAPDSYPNDQTRRLSYKTNMVKGASQIPVIGDASYPIATNVKFYPAPPRPPAFSGDHSWVDTTADVDQMKRFCLDRHNMAVNWCFMDGSVRTVNLKGLWLLPFHDMWNRKGFDVEEIVDWPDWMRNAKY